MKRLVFVLLVLFTINLAAQDQGGNAADIAAIKEAALNYVDGAYSGDGVRMAKSLYPGLNKIMVTPLRKGTEILTYTTFDMLIEGANAGLIDKPADQRNIEVTILKIHHNVASVKVDSAMFIDYIHVGKANGK